MNVSSVLSEGVAEKFARKSVFEIDVADVARVLTARAQTNSSIGNIFASHGLGPKVRTKDLLALPGARDVFTPSGGLQPKYAKTLVDHKGESVLSYMEHPDMHGLGLMWDIFVGLTEKVSNIRPN